MNTMTKGILLAAFLLAPVHAEAQTLVLEYYHLDALGSVRVVTDQNRTVVRQHDYFPFGEEVPPQALGGDAHRFTGKPRDIETAFNYLGARYYVDRTGRFLTMDPILDRLSSLVDPQRWNRFAHAKSNPQIYIDPDGRQAKLILNVLKAAAKGESMRQAFAGVLDNGQIILSGDPSVGELERLKATGLLVLDVSGASDLLGGLGRGARALGIIDGVHDLSKSAGAIDRNGLTVAGRALQKHGAREGSAFPSVSGHEALNKIGQRIVDSILKSPGLRRDPNRYGGFDYFAPDGRGLRYGKDGRFIGFLEPNK